MSEILTPEQVKTIQAWLPEAVTVEAVVQEAERLIASHEALLAERDAATRKAFEEAAQEAERHYTQGIADWLRRRAGEGK